MSVLIIVLKVILAIVALYRLFIMFRFRRSDTNVRFSFELMSMLEVDAVIGMTIVSLLAAIDERSYTFTIILLLASIVLNISNLFRVIVAGDSRILIGPYDFDLKDIKGMNNSRITLHVFVKGGRKIDVVVPLTNNETIRKMKYIRN
ncbi:MAG: hypothetical protein K5908_07190 [Erysipelotrichaceae bacterium]|jgi:hypothetical protein|nr:hypothetical protein [Erysipelotrichaceae bacterium]